MLDLCAGGLRADVRQPGPGLDKRHPRIPHVPFVPVRCSDVAQCCIQMLCPAAGLRTLRWHEHRRDTAGPCSLCTPCMTALLQTAAPTYQQGPSRRLQRCGAPTRPACAAPLTSSWRFWAPPLVAQAALAGPGGSAPLAWRCATSWPRWAGLLHALALLVSWRQRHTSAGHVASMSFDLQSRPAGRLLLAS